MSIEWGIEELAGLAMGKTEDETEQMINDSTVDDELYERYEIDFETYVAIVKDLLPHTPVVEAALSGTKFNAFVTKENNRMIVRKEFSIGQSNK